MNHKIEKSSVPPLAKLRQHRSKKNFFPEVSSPCVLLWKWRRAYRAASARLDPSHGTKKKEKNLRKKCKSERDAKRGSRADLARELLRGSWGGLEGRRGFWCSPEKKPASNRSRGVPPPRSTLRDLDAIKRMAILRLRTTHETNSRRSCATTRTARDGKYATLGYHIKKLAVY